MPAKAKDKETNKAKDKDKERDTEKEKEGQREKERRRELEKEREREREREKDREREHEFAVEAFVEQKLSGNPHQKLRDGPYAGLENLGSTCYMNALMQCVFNDCVFLKEFFVWSAPTEQELKERYSSAEERQFHAERGRTLSTLQRLACAMRESKAQRLQTAPLAVALNVDVSQQQDAHEFYNKLMNAMESQFQQSSPDLAKQFISLITGDLVYNSSCSLCKHASTNEDRFFELKLPLQENSSLEQCLADYFKEDQPPEFKCEHCNAEHSVTRVPKISRLPALLTVLLCRFTFDQQTKSEHKVTKPVDFTTSLLLEKYLQPSPSAKRAGRFFFGGGNSRSECPTYDLCGVVAHIGKTVSSGHYVAYVRHSPSQTWWRCDDFVVTECDDFPPESMMTSTSAFYVTVRFDGREVDTTWATGSPTTMAETPYMLFYRRRDLPKSTPIPPTHQAMRCVSLENQSLEDQAAQYEQRVKQERKILQMHKDYFEQMQHMLPAKPTGGSYYFVDVEWLRKCMMHEAGPQAQLPEIDNTRLLCAHGRVAPGDKNIRRMKRISPEAWNTFYRKYKGGPALSAHQLCTECAQEWLTRKVVAHEYKKVKEWCLSHMKCNSGNFCVSEQFISEWKKARGTMTPEAALLVKPIRCCHGALRADVTCVAVSEEVWLQVCQVCGGETPTALLRDAPPCIACEHDRIRAHTEQQELQSVKTSERLGLYDKCFWHPKYLLCNEKYVLISCSWFNKWRNYLLADGEHPGPVDSSDLLCEHRLLLCDVVEQLRQQLDVPIPLASTERSAPPKACMAVLMPQELFSELRGRYTEVVLPVVPVLSFTDDLSAADCVATSPPPCSDCAARLLRESDTMRARFVHTELALRREYVGTMTLTSFTANVNTACVCVSHDTTVEELRLMVFEKMDIEPSCQLLECGGQLLSRNSRTLGSYGVTADSTITVSQVESGAAVEPENSRIQQQRETTREPTRSVCASCPLPYAVATASPTSRTTSTPAVVVEPRPQAFEHSSLADYAEFKKSKEVAAAVAEAAPKGKACRACTLLNPLGRTQCEACGSKL
eukprot:TRINITY_DN1666_c1_g1_i1.p1 TRINITY_DN1666_c1_g1~~TRINITY_DN1666_c1_g1_i1.p1  ORF type:complete len:1225 (-),score=285.83 TRINITY_DN1666_c1_g1_i1:42-3221(-)